MSRSNFHISNFRKQCGLTLIEIVMSLLFLAGSLAVVVSISRTSMINATSARDTTQAQLLCESIMSQLMNGMIEFESVYDEPVLDFPDSGASNPNDGNDYKWTYSVEINTLDDYGLLEVIVTVTQYLPNNPSREPISCRLVRWMLDKAAAKEALESESAASSSETTTSSATPSANQ
jgi:type II secretory pathway pseudopilin PulG